MKLTREQLAELRRKLLSGGRSTTLAFFCMEATNGDPELALFLAICLVRQYPELLSGAEDERKETIAERNAAIRALHATGRYTLSELGGRFGLSASHVSNIVHGRR